MKRAVYLTLRQWDLVDGILAIAHRELTKEYEITSGVRKVAMHWTAEELAEIRAAISKGAPQ